jgi:hypothetical protein
MHTEKEVGIALLPGQEVVFLRAVSNQPRPDFCCSNKQEKEDEESRIGKNGN